MYRYIRFITVIAILFFLGSCTKDIFSIENRDKNIKNEDNFSKENIDKNYKKIDIKKYYLEDFFILSAYDLEAQNSYEEAREIYLNLFFKTNNSIYLVNYLRVSLLMNDYKSIVENSKKYYFDNIKDEEEILRLYSFALLNQKDFENALKYGLILVKKYKNSNNYELLGNIYLVKEDFKNSYESYLKANKYSNSASSIHALSGIEFFKFNQKDKAINRLQIAIKDKNYNYLLVLQALLFFDTLKDDEKVNNLLKDSYKFYLENNLFYEKQELINLIFERFKTEDKIIDFLVTNGIEDDFLLNLYISKGDKKNGLKLASKLYDINQIDDFLAYQAMFRYEIALEDNNLNNKELEDIIFMLEEVVETSSRALYQNYLAYILIDNDKDYLKGIALVKDALSQDPENYAYIDTLAWGEYKIKNCKKALELIKIVIEKVGLEDKEVKLHYEKIKECTKNDIR